MLVVTVSFCLPCRPGDGGAELYVGHFPVLFRPGVPGARHLEAHALRAAFEEVASPSVSIAIWN